MDLHDSFEFTHRGRNYLARTYYDNDPSAPWEEEDGHGPVSDWTTRDKRSGEVVLDEDRRSKRYYDMQAAVAMARKDWGLNDERKAQLMERLGKDSLTRGEIAAEAARLDYERLRRWCNNGWYYVGVSVVHVPNECDDPEDLEEDYQHALWGIESDCTDYIHKVAEELADEVHTLLEREAGELQVEQEKNTKAFFDLERAALDVQHFRGVPEAVADGMNRLRNRNREITVRLREIQSDSQPEELPT